MTLLLIARITCLELLQNNALRSFFAAILIIPFIGYVFSNLFMMDIGKVFVDAMAGAAHFEAIVFILFFVTPLLAKDVEQHICYFLITPPVTRLSYLSGRLLGVISIFILLYSVSSLSGAIASWLLLHDTFSIYHSGLNFFTILKLNFFLFFHYISLIGIAFFIFSWATGLAEALLFTASVIMFSWVFPSIVKAIENPDIAKSIPPIIQKTIDFVFQILPHLNGNSIALALAYGALIPVNGILLYCTEHLSYTVICFILAFWLFSRRDI